jgi:hypothetical protein
MWLHREYRDRTGLIRVRAFLVDCGEPATE